MYMYILMALILCTCNIPLSLGNQLIEAERDIRYHSSEASVGNWVILRRGYGSESVPRAVALVLYNHNELDVVGYAEDSMLILLCAATVRVDIINISVRSSTLSIIRLSPPTLSDRGSGLGGRYLSCYYDCYFRNRTDTQPHKSLILFNPSVSLVRETEVFTPFTKSLSQDANAIRFSRGPEEKNNRTLIETMIQILEGVWEKLVGASVPLYGRPPLTSFSPHNMSPNNDLAHRTLYSSPPERGFDIMETKSFEYQRRVVKPCLKERNRAELRRSATLEVSLCQIPAPLNSRINQWRLRRERLERCGYPSLLYRDTEDIEEANYTSVLLVNSFVLPTQGWAVLLSKTPTMCSGWVYIVPDLQELCTEDTFKSSSVLP